MNEDAQQDLFFIKNELNNIIKELNSISNGIERNFEGIGNDVCARCLSDIACCFAEVREKLDSMDLAVLSSKYTVI